MLLIVFCISTVLTTPARAYHPYRLPEPGKRIEKTASYSPPLLSGLEINPENPLNFQFYIDTGDDSLSKEDMQHEATRLIKHFLTSLTIPDNELWVNLTPGQQNRVVAPSLGQTGTGRDLLEQDYLLKQFTASLLYPEQKLGAQFWQKFYAKVRDRYEDYELPVDLIHKIWIVPKDAVVYQKDTQAYVLNCHLKVMLEDDYLEELQLRMGGQGSATRDQQREREMTGVTRQIIREILLPEIEQEVNEGQNFAPLRQIYHAMILATWYKMTLEKGLLSQIYIDQNKTKGVDLNDPQTSQKIYARYMQALKKGVYNYIREDFDPISRSTVPRQYFSGGLLHIDRRDIRIVRAEDGRISPLDQALLSGYAEKHARLFQVTTDLFDIGTNADAAILSDQEDDHPKYTDEQLAQTFESAAHRIVRPVFLDRELRNFENEMFVTDHIAWDELKPKSLTVYDFIDQIPTGGYQGGYILGINTWQRNYQNLARFSGLTEWKEAYTQLYGDGTEHVEEFLEHITARATAKQPIFFLVPRDALTHPNRNAAARELEWFLDHPERTEHVHFVFGAYQMITPSDWHESVFGGDHGVSFDHKQQIWQYVLKNYRQYRAEYVGRWERATLDMIRTTAVMQLQNSFEEFLLEFKRLTAQATQHFRQRDWHGSLDDAQLRLRLHDTITYNAASALSVILGDQVNNGELWQAIRENLRDNYLTEADAYKLNLILSFLDEVMSHLTKTDLPEASADYSLTLEKMPKDRKSVVMYRVDPEKPISNTLQEILSDVGLTGLFAHLPDDTYTAGSLLEDQLNGIAPDLKVHSIEVLRPLFVRNKAAYIIGRINTNYGVRPLVIALMHVHGGIVVDAVLANQKTAKSLLLSSTRSAFHVNSSDITDIVVFINELYPDVSFAQIYDLLGLTQRSQYVYLQELQARLDEGQRLDFIGAGPQSITFSAPGSALVFKVVPDDARNRREIIRNYLETHNSNRLGQLLDTWVYTNLRLPREQVAPELLERLAANANYDVQITSTDVVFNRVYAQRRIKPLPDFLTDNPDPETQLDTLLKVGWNMKHLAAMGIVPTDMSLRHFGITSWGRVVYLNNAGIGRMEDTEFRAVPKYQHVEQAVHIQNGIESSRTHYRVYPELIAGELAIPEQYREDFLAVHEDLFTPDFWNSVQWRMGTEPLPEIYPYSNKYRINTKQLQLILTKMGIPHSGDDEKSLLDTPSLDVSELSMHGLNFLRLRVPNPRARILVVEPIGVDIIGMLHRQLGNVDFDIIQPESEIVEEAEYWTPGVQGKLRDLVQANHYDYVLGYVNETFNKEFFDEANIKGLLLFSTGVHNIDLEAASANGIAVTNAPGPTTVAVAEQNIGLMLDSLYSEHISTRKDDGGKPLATMAANKPADPEAIAQILWYQLLRKSLKLDEMFAFASEGRYVRTGVGSYATVYHDQLGQNKEAHIETSIGIIGLDSAGKRLIEMAIAHEVSTIYVLQEEFQKLDDATLQRFASVISHLQNEKSRYGLNIEFKPVTAEEMALLATYTVATPDAYRSGLANTMPPEFSIDVRADSIFIDTPTTLQLSLAGLNVGIQGLGRIGKAVAQRVAAMGANILINQRNHNRKTYLMARKSLLNLKLRLGKSEAEIDGQVTFVDKHVLIEQSNVLTTLTPLTDETTAWIDAEQLKDFGTSAPGKVRVIVSQVKNIIDEQAMLDYLLQRPDVQVRLDVVAQEEKGDAHTRFRDSTNRPLRNIKIAGHTAAAVPGVRRLKVSRALENLEYLMNDKIPPNILNAGVMHHQEKTVSLSGLNFKRMTVPRPKAKVLVVEPLNQDIVHSIQGEFPDVNFDVLQSDSEVIDRDGRMISGIDANLDKIVAENDYDFCVGYCNANFDDPFFDVAKLRGLVLFATAEHHIDLQAATRHRTLVTTSPGPTTTAVAEQNIALALDGLYGETVFSLFKTGTVRLSHFREMMDIEEQLGAAQIMWYSLLREALKLDEMFAFGKTGRYAKTGVAIDATVYHDQLGQNREAGITNSIGILGLNRIGVQLLELAIAHEVDTIYVLKNEFDRLNSQTRQRISDLINVIGTYSQTQDFTISLRIVDIEELANQSNYILKTPGADPATAKSKTDAVVIDADEIYVTDRDILRRTQAPLNFGVHGIRRIGSAVVQRALALGFNLIVDTDSLKTRDVESKVTGFEELVHNRRLVYGPKLNLPAYVPKDVFFRTSNIITTLGDSSQKKNLQWVDQSSLDAFGVEAPGDARILINASKYQVDEPALIEYAREHPGVEIRLDVLNDEGSGASRKLFVDSTGKDLSNVKLSGHTAAAVWAVRRLKINRALNNLRRLIDGEIPEHLLNPEVLKDVRKDEAMTGQKDDVTTVGGINLNPRLLDLQIRRNEAGVPLPLPEQPLEQMRIQGFIPVIINIQPILNIPQLLGLETDPRDADFTRDLPADIPSRNIANRSAISYNQIN